MNIKQMLICLTILTINNACIASNDGFEKAFKKAARKKTTHSIFDSSSNDLPVAEPLPTPTFLSDVNTSLPQATAQIIEEKEYFSMSDPRVQQIILNKMRKEGSLDTTVLETSKGLIKYYKTLQEKRTPFLIDSIRQEELSLLGNLLSVQNHLNNAAPTEEVTRMQAQVKATIEQINA